ncbi:exodeoxyribonuclease V alpha subunit [Scopulibacillus darangshiensis]|uniref:ATP-dependent RecD2 DNA helicase n=1 Tax=Scopulibacillus darangshiensis TaxID=442528 RepID=A0A4R2PDU4_9BACL|nr:ATP-dependent RecD-like DNA helicase [Scopulibacillus darangshiensis]TCP32281.1 exodeoxyribonuclease V alpha subunit [Scopulibacillus darangshiensis]
MADQSSFDLFSEEQKYIKGTPHRIIFQNNDNAYTVMQVKIEETNEQVEEKEIVVIGFFPMIHLHEAYHFRGKIKVHPKYGKQYEVDQYRKLLPQSKAGMVQYLSGDLFPGIGEKTAENIMDTLGEDAISKILDDPACLDDVSKLTEEKAKLLYEILIEHQGLEKIMIALSDYGFGPQLSMKIYQAYGHLTLDMIRDNPYQLVQDIEGIGFQRADELGKALGMSGNHPDRIQAGCLFWLNERALDDGNVFMPYDELIKQAQKLLSTPNEPVTDTDVAREIDVLEEDGKLVLEDKDVYLPSLYFAEKGIVTSIKKITEQTAFRDEFSETEFLTALGELEERLEMQYAPSQKEAIKQAIESPVMLLTGGPGTGKTTVIKGIVDVYAELHGVSLNTKDYDEDNPFPVLLVAPTGRAAKRMSESTGLPAVTIHRLLGWKGGSGYDHDDENPIKGRLLIIDEMSMVDIWLANQLFKSLPPDIQVVIVGDEDQLPSVGPGQILRDFLHSEMMPTVRLNDIYRQSEGSSIIDLAHAIKGGGLPDDLLQPKDDRRFFGCHQNQIVDAICQVCKNAHQKGFSPKDIQVLAPMYRGSAGIEAINTALQALFNPPSEQKRELTFGDKLYRIGDKVLQLVNNPDQQVFNGDIGEIVAIFTAKETTDKEETVVVSFDGIEVSYLKRDLTQITLAYCCSIHKSQGSEFPIVVLPVVKGYHRMLRRNLIYTAVTRSKEYLILCGDQRAFEYAVDRSDVDRRHSKLAGKLKERLGSASESIPFPEGEEIVTEIPAAEDEPYKTF